MGDDELSAIRAKRMAELQAMVRNYFATLSKSCIGHFCLFAGEILF